jgi:hypothetical protein
LPPVPFPPDRGDKIRSHHVLKALANWAGPRRLLCRNVADRRRSSTCASRCHLVHADRVEALPVAGIEAMCAASRSA